MFLEAGIEEISHLPVPSSIFHIRGSADAVRTSCRLTRTRNKKQNNALSALQLLRINFGVGEIKNGGE